MRCLIALLSTSLIVGFQAAAAQKTWVGGASAWNNPGAWDPPGVPEAADEIAIAGGSVALGGTVTIGNRLVWTGGTLHSGTLEVSPAGAMEIEGDTGKTLLQLAFSNEGTVRLKDSGRLDCLFTGFNQSVLITNLAGGLFEFTGAAEVAQNNGSGWPVNLQFVNEGTVRKTGPAVSGIVLIPFHNRGTVEVQAGPFGLSGGGTSPGVFSVAEGASVSLRTGTFNFDSARWQGPGPVRISNSMRLDGTFTAENFGLAGGDLSGEFDVSGGFEWTVGRLVNARARFGAGKHRLGGSNETVLFNSTLVNAGDLELASANLLFLFNAYNQRAAFTNESAGVVRFRGGDRFAQQNYGGWPPLLLNVANEGVFRVSGDSTNLVLDLPLDNRGAIEVDQGVFQQRGGGTSSGRWSVADGASAEWLGGTYACTNVVVQGPGPLKLLGSVRLDGKLDAANLVLAGGSLRGDCAIAGGFHWSGGRLSSLALHLGAGNHFVTAGAGQVMENSWIANAGTLQFVNAGVTMEFTGYNQFAAITNLSGGRLGLRDGSTLEQRNPAGWPPVLLQLVNDGTLEVAGALTNSLLRIPLHNRGEVIVNGGVFEHRGGGGISTGSWTVAAGATAAWQGGNHAVTNAIQRGPGPLVITGAAQLNGSFSAENLVLADGVLSGDCDVSGGFHWTGGRLTGMSLRLGAGEHSISGDAGQTMLNVALANAGHLVVDAAKVALEFTSFSQGASITNNATGVLELRGGTTFAQRNPGGWPPVVLQVVNDGEMRAAGPGTNALLAVPFHNRGRVDVQSGTLTQTGGGVSSGEFRVAADAQYTFHSGTFDYGGSRWSGPGPASIIGTATLRGSFDAGNFALAAGDLTADCTVRGGWRWTGGRLINSAFRLGEGDHRISGPEEKIMLNALIENGGRLLAKDGKVAMLFTGFSQSNLIRNTAAGTFDIEGDWTVEQRNPAGWPAVALGLFNDGRLRKLGGGIAVVQAVPLTSSGPFELESGVLQVNGNLTLGATSQLTLAAGTAVPLKVSGTATLAGTVGARTAAGFTPAEGTQLRVLEAGAVTGAFANPVAINPGHFFTYDVSYEPKGVLFTAHSVLTEPTSLTSAGVTDGSFGFAVNVPTTLEVWLESSTDLVNWQLDAKTIATASPLIWRDTRPATDPARFYRVTLLP